MKNNDLSVAIEEQNNFHSKVNIFDAEVFMSEEIGSVALALSRAQGAIENVSKDKQAYGYKYADLASCLSAIKSSLRDNSLSLVQPVIVRDNKQFLLTLLLHESGQWIKSTISIDYFMEKIIMKQCNSLQQFGAILSYLRRYALAALVGLAQEDDDGQLLAEEVKNNKQKDIILIQELIKLCQENKIDLKDFAKHFAIDSKNLDSVKHGVANFTALKERFLTETQL